jgi:cytochrome c oxidase subunit 2
MRAGAETTTQHTCKRFARAVTALAIAATMAACSSPFSTLEPAGPAADAIARLWWVMLIGATLLFVLVAVLLALAFVRPGAGRNTPDSVWIVGGGVILPGIVLTPLTIYALASGERLFQARAEPAMQVDVLALQWGWHFTYRTDDGTMRRSNNVLHIPAGQPVRLNITSADVIHSFWVPRLAGKIDATPGHVTTLRLNADAPGRYRGLCAEFCGTAHVEMQFVVEAHASEDEFRRIIDELPTVSAGERLAGAGP